MTTPPTHARTANEQLIAVLEAEVVTMREAMEKIEHGWAEDDQSKFCNELQNIAMAALSTSTDYANKVVVDREEWEVIEELVTCIKGWIICTETDADSRTIFRLLARLDSLRKQGGGARCKVCGSTENIERDLCDDHEILSRTEPAP